MLIKTGQVVNLYGPYGNISYKSKGSFELKKNDNIYIKKFNKIGMIAGGSGITPIFQLINKIISSNSDKTALSLIYSTKHQVFIYKQG